MKYYTGNVTNTPSTIAVLPAPYYWWEAGAMWGAMVDYYHYTGDPSYNEVTTQALLSQVGPSSDFMMPNHKGDEGNDDQAFWGFAAMSAAEKGFPQPTTGKSSWVQLVENLWNTQVNRWDLGSCNGGLKWQIFLSNNGYDYKNSVANGAFFQLSARLARFTGNQTYLDWAQKSYDWSVNVGLIDPSYQVFDGTDDTKNCSSQSKVVWTYNTGIYMYGAAVLYNFTNGSALWGERTQGFLDASAQYFNPYKNYSNAMCETACETVNTCNNDEYSFKGYLSRFMWASTLMAPFTKNQITTYLQGSAEAAARACSGGANGVTCGQHWYWATAYDGSYGVGQQMSALETIQGLLVSESEPPVTGVSSVGKAPPSPRPKQVARACAAPQ
jgi:mannan endo-1,6-alpha-mannosidase